MADQKDRDSKRPQDFSSDSGLGNLPPLSDFDSQSGINTPVDGGLPPLSGFDSDISRTPSGGGGLPPISQIDIETPTPTGGNIRATPAGFAKPKDTFSSGGGSSGGGFQDLAADSDFSPETPEIGPGPDSNVDTPMFDSAFGGGSGGFSAVVDTPAPTQAMETPMFGMSGPMPGGAAGGGGFGDFGGQAAGFGGGFGAPAAPGARMDFNVGTPAPDFSPDTDMGVPAKKGGKAKGASGGSPAVIAAAAVVALIVGIVLGPYASEFVPLPNPAAARVGELETRVTSLSKENERLKGIQEGAGGGDKKISPEQYQELLGQIEQATKDLTAKTAELDAASKSLEEKSAQLSQVDQDLQDRTAEFVTLQEDFEKLDNEVKITQARQRGLIAEVERLTGQVGLLEEANARSVATKESLEHAVNRLAIAIGESIPLTPDKYSHDTRKDAVQDLRDKVAAAPWVTPALLEAYTSLYLRELEISSAKEYFFARIPVTDKLGVLTRKWAECLMVGNTGVRYRTLDGQNVGVYENTGAADNPAWGVKETFDPNLQREIASAIAASRTPNYQEAIAMLLEKEKAAKGGSDFQRNFDSL